MKRSRTARSPVVKSPQLKSQKKSKDETPVSDCLRTPDTKYNQTNHQRTSGGISKSLLTPCRRMGLGRNRKINLNTSLGVVTSPLTSRKVSADKIDDNPIASVLKEIVNNVEEEIIPTETKTKDIKQKLTVISDEAENMTLKINDPKPLAKACVNIINERVNKTKIKKKVLTKEKVVLEKELISTSPKIALTLQQKGKDWCVKTDDKSKSVTPSSSQKSSSSCSLSDDEDNIFQEKTIVDRKSYNKVQKKGKLGLKELSVVAEKIITQADLDEIRERIKIKEDKLELLKNQDTNNHHVKELEDCILRWRVGCQQALQNLLQVGKEKGKVEETVEIGELINMLQIPFDLVKYDPEQMTFG